MKPLPEEAVSHKYLVGIWDEERRCYNPTVAYADEHMARAQRDRLLAKAPPGTKVHLMKQTIEFLEI